MITMAQAILEWWDVTGSSTKFLFLAVLVGMCTGIFWGMVLSPCLEEVTALQLEEQRLEEELTKQDSLRQKRAILRAEVLELREQVQVLDEAVGSAIGMTQVASDLFRVAKKVGLSIVLWKPNITPESPGLSRGKGWPARIEVEGDFHGLGRFFGELTRLPKSLVVTAFSIVSSSRPHSAKESIQASVELSTYDPSSGEMGAVVP